MANDPNNNEINDDPANRAPVIPPLVRSPYPTRSRSRRRQLEHQRMLDDQLTADPLGLVARTTSAGSSSTAAAGTEVAAANATPEGLAPSVPPSVASNITRRRRQLQRPAQPTDSRPSDLFSTPGATTAASAAQPHHVSTAVPQSAASHVSVASDYMIGKGLVQARISPMACAPTGVGSGSNSAKNSRRRRFFPPSRPSPRASTGSSHGNAAGGDGGNTAPEDVGNGAAKNLDRNTANSSSNPDEKVAMDKERDLILHGMNITRLRKLTLSCLGMGTTKGSMGMGMGMTTQSPKMAVFFAGMVHSKTKNPMDAYVYARALLQNDQPKRAVKWIEQSDLLRCYYSENREALEADGGGQGDVSSKKTANKLYEKLEELKTLQVESLLLAAQALSELSEWTAVLQLLEDTQHYTFPESHSDQYKQQVEMNNNNNMDHEDTENSFHPNHMTIVTTPANSTSVIPPPPPLIPLHLDDDDDIAWQQLAESLRPSRGSAAITPDRIHPLSRICQMRARAYSELGHPLRANLYWNRALQIDPWCVLALEGLLETSVQSPASVVEFVLMAMSARGSGEDPAATGNDMKDNDANEVETNDDAEWLRALYLARVCTAAPNTANVPTGGVGVAGNEINNKNSNDGGAKPADTDDPMEDEVDENDDGNGDENMTGTVGASASFALSPNVTTRARSRGRSNDNGHVEDTNRDDPSFWQDASSLQLLTPIPQQQSVADMSAAGASLFFPNSAGSGHQLPGNSDHSTAVANTSDLSNSAAAAVAVGSALDTLWNKFQLRKSPEVLAMAAQNAYRRYDWNAALQYCEELSEVDPLSSNTNKAAFCHVSTLVQLNRKRPLFRLAHEWVETSPKEARSWFAVGAYYYACQRYHVAQRHFCRATRLDPHCVEAWIAFGASFAACDESDQALASFRAAQRLAPGNHTSLLYIGMEYLRTNHLVLAQHFLKAANDSSGGTDPLVKSETGVLKLNQRKYSQAITWFLMALGGHKEWAASMSKLLATSTANSFHNNGETSPKYLDALSSLIEIVQDSYWEPTLFNLAHAYRKERRFDAAVICLEQCLALKESASAHSALGYCLHLQSIVLSTRARIAKRKQKNGKAYRERSNCLLHRAIDSYHQSLAKKPDDPFASEMLQKALSDALDQTDFFLSDDDVVIPDPGDHGGILASPASAQKVAGKKGHHYQLAATTPRNPRGSLGSLSTAGTGMGLAAVGADQSSLWTEDGLSVSVESSNDDVDMT